MTKTANLVFSLALVIPTVAQAGQQASQVVRVNTDDVAGYLAWAEASAPVILADASGAISACAPRFGAEAEGDIYWWSSTTSFESLLSIDVNAPAVTREIAKVAPIRTVISRDLWNALKASDLPLEAGSTFSALVLTVETKQASGYVALLTELEEALHQNGFSDVFWNAFAVTTGEFANHIMAFMNAPTLERLGAAMDAGYSESWNNLGDQFNEIRTVVQQMVHDCYVYAVQQ